MTWISAPAGSGKTTLVASFLEAHKIPCLWYQIDEGRCGYRHLLQLPGRGSEKSSSSENDNTHLSLPLNTCKDYPL